MAVKVCRSCGYDNKENAFICASCSKTLKEAIVRGTLDSEKIQTTLNKNAIKLCTNCGEKLEIGALKCKYCGTPTISAKQYSSNYNAPQTYGSERSYFLLYLVTFILPIVGLIVGGIIAFDDDPDKSATGKSLLIFGLVMIVIGVIFWSIVLS
jgi:uncharacterized membrane protein YvbJ